MPSCTDKYIIKFSTFLIFFLFSIAYLFEYQEDMLTFIIFKIRGYRSVKVFYLIIFIILTQIISQKLLDKYCKISLPCYFITYIPSFLILCILSIHSLSGAFLSIIYILLFIVLLLKKEWVESYLSNKYNFSFLSNIFLFNNVALFFLFAFFSFFFINNDLFSARLEIETAILKNDYEKAETIHKKIDCVDDNLSMLRVYCLSKLNVLPYRLFEYKLSGGSMSMLPSDSVKTLILPSKIFFNNLGIVEKYGIRNIKTFLRDEFSKNKSNRKLLNYLLCAYLLDKDLDSFVGLLVSAWDKKNPLPRYYQEALILYLHKRSKPILMFKNNTLEADFSDYISMQNEHNIQEDKIKKLYGKTFWYYYDYHKVR